MRLFWLVREKEKEREKQERSVGGGKSGGYSSLTNRT